MPYITTAKEARNLVRNKLNDNKVSLGIEYIGTDDEQRLPRYPAVVVSVGPREKELHSTGTFALSFRVIIWVYHALMSVSHAERSDLDLDLVDAIEALLEEDMTFNDQIVQGWVENEIPGIFQPRSGKGDLVIGTRMVWAAVSQSRF